MSRTSAGSPRLRDQEGKRESVLEAAEQLFRKKGYYLTTTEDIARESGYSVGSLYNLIGDKEQIYGEVLGRIGASVVIRTKETIRSEPDPNKAVERLINVRLYNFLRDHLFFQAFLCEGLFGILPPPERLPRRVVSLHDEYVHQVELLFKRVIAHQQLSGLNPMNLVLSLESTINVFMAYWERPGQSDSLHNIAHHIKEIILNPVSLKRLGSVIESEEATPEVRHIHVSKFDFDRLRELISVARHFGSEDSCIHLKELETLLSQAKIVTPKEVPPDLVTMNSVVRLWDLDAGREVICGLVFPKDTNLKEENTSVLSPLGAAVFGSRIGDVFAVASTKGSTRYKVDSIPYQPEAAGDYQL